MDTPAAPAPPRLPMANLTRVIGSHVRWLILRELVKGRPLPAMVVGKAVGISADAAAKHLNEMAELGVLEKGYGRLYEIAPAWRPAPGTRHLDFGHCLVRLDTDG
jgi:DNA-binding HxlR family transcriptional regulator